MAPILGIWDGHDAGACLVDASEGRILCAANEERYTRRKLEVGFPRQAIEACLRSESLAAGDITEVAVSTFDPAKTLTRWIPGMKESYYLLRRRKRPPRPLDPLRRSFKYLVTSWKGNALTRGLSRWALKRSLSDLGLNGARLRVFPHHLAHAAAAAYTSELDPALVVTLDGVGDGLSGTLSALRGGELALLGSIEARDSLGIFFEQVTQLMNMRELEDEGKVMALAGYGYQTDEGVNPLASLFTVDGNKLECRLGVLALRRYLKRSLSMMPTEQFAWMAQRALESTAGDWIRNAVRSTGLSRIAYAGGVASNIKVNLVLRELPEVEEIFVFPHMGDGGLALGAALARAVEKGPRRFFPLKDSKLGPEPEPGDVAAEVEKLVGESGLEVARPVALAEEVARLLVEERIVCWFQGRMEYGPRALGGRSILARPDSPVLRDRLNLELKRRVWYQPFCPSILEDEAPRLLENAQGRPNRYMTMAYRVRPDARALLAGVTGQDGTCRPQMVGPGDGVFYDLLCAMRKRTGLGALLNTSFNRHGEPIVATPRQALETFVACGADAIVIEGFLVRRKG